MRDFSSFFQECEGAPRLNELSSFFAATAAGRAGKPTREPQVDRRLLKGDRLLDSFVSLHERRRGPFDHHYHSSIPYRLEEECRLGHAILQYSQGMPEPLHLYSLGTAEGTMARTISELADGRVESLSCSPNIENQHSFLAYGDPPHATFFVGPFHHLTPDKFHSRENLAKFASGFDVIFEDTTFQMYSPNRRDQIGFVSQHLKDDGLFVFVEKFRNVDIEEYKHRERQKDHGFKARFFSHTDIMAKEATVLTVMNQNEVTLDDMEAALTPYFHHSYITWNSGNFYSLVASNSLPNIERFISGLIEPAIPGEYVYGPLPRPLLAALAEARYCE
ncbi:class I SAM-dependent methyltransferase [Rhizobium rhizogenes]|uniref:class I SAM-dependent methyltransferase n=1 Tax=Rhizobium rhizogenes TaxID=359 RepID=UPI000646D8BC|nr:class I SAM-dependent methyltransferase [Rhizobium rhizogenes]NTI30512.1 class I SAM-dependent methyltransferase [Rhizobium rhizogenes]NTI36659.1 class I SAM-dependent methyltransferase [Rhizobium rhizogenes]QRM39963.1 class I SAM-dependent methyltransferase [Rhizobium rhizogenes]